MRQWQQQVKAIAPRAGRKQEKHVTNDASLCCGRLELIRRKVELVGSGREFGFRDLCMRRPENNHHCHSRPLSINDSTYQALTLRGRAGAPKIRPGFRPQPDG